MKSETAPGVSCANPADWSARGYVDAQAYAGVFRCSIEEPEAFGREETAPLDWIKPWIQVSACSEDAADFPRDIRF